MSIEFRTMPADEPPASNLIAAMVAEMTELYGRIEGPGGFVLG